MINAGLIVHKNGSLWFFKLITADAEIRCEAEKPEERGSSRQIDDVVIRAENLAKKYGCKIVLRAEPIVAGGERIEDQAQRIAVSRKHYNKVYEKMADMRDDLREMESDGASGQGR